jgi:hypothetical protein
MKPTRDDYEVIQQLLADELGAEIAGEAFEPGTKGPAAKRKKWVPLHGPTQTKIFNDRSDVVGACSEKYTGKSVVMGDCVIAHCYEEFDALAVIIGNSHRALAEGICHDLLTFLLPRWRDGNRAPLYIRDEKGKLIDNPQAGELIDSGIGLEYTAWKFDPNNKDLYIKIRNRFGGWSRIRVIAIPYAEQVQARMTNLNASMFYLEEATRCNGEDYYTWPSLQLWRRHGIKGPQQFLFSCNPDDPESWVYKWMYRDCVVLKSEEGRDWPNDPEKPGIRRDPDTAFYYLHYHENEHNVSAKNRANLRKTLRAKPILRQRLYECKWVAMPPGDAIFAAEFDERKHMKGDVEKKRGLTPIPGYPIVMSFDWGKRNMGFSFRQIIETDEGPFSILFDELAYFQELHKTSRVSIAILEKMRYWTEWLREKKDDPAEKWCWYFITGDDATTNFNPDSGNIYARDLEDHLNKEIEEELDRYRGLEIPTIRGCPRPRESVEKRVDIVAESLMEERAVYSETCVGHRGMLFHLPEDPDKKGVPAKGNRWIHIFDGYSYADYYRRFNMPDGFVNYDDGPAIEVA